MFERFKKKEESKSHDIPEGTKASLGLVKKLISNVFEDLDQNSIQPEVKLEYLGLDSIKFLNVLLGFQDELDMDLDDIVEMVDLSKLHTVQDLVDLTDEFKNSKK